MPRRIVVQTPSTWCDDRDGRGFRVWSPRHTPLVKINRVIAKRIDYDRDGVNLRADINAAIAINVNESSGEATAQSDQRIVSETRRTARASAESPPKPGAPDG